MIGHLGLLCLFGPWASWPLVLVLVLVVLLVLVLGLTSPCLRLGLAFIPYQILKFSTEISCQWSGRSQVRVSSCSTEGSRGFKVILQSSKPERRLDLTLFFTRYLCVQHIGICVGLQQDRHSCRVQFCSKVESGVLGNYWRMTIVKENVFHEIRVQDENESLLARRKHI